MRLPRDVSGADLARLLGRYGYNKKGLTYLQKHGIVSVDVRSEPGAPSLRMARSRFSVW